MKKLIFSLLLFSGLAAAQQAVRFPLTWPPIPINVTSGGGISGLTTNVIPKATSATTIGDSSLTDNGTLLSTTLPFSTGLGSGNAGSVDMVAGTVQAIGANSFGIGAGASMTISQRLQSPNAVAVAHSLMVIGAPSSNISTWAYKAVPDCTDTAGNHLNFTQSTDAFSCGTSGGGSQPVEYWLPAAQTQSGSSIQYAAWDCSLLGCAANVGFSTGGIAAIALGKGNTGAMWARFPIPTNFAGTITVKIWHSLTSGGTGTGQFDVALSCNSLPIAINTAVTYNTADSVSWNVTSNANGLYTSSTPPTTGCTAGQIAWLRIMRANTGTAADDASVLGAYVKIQ